MATKTRYRHRPWTPEQVTAYNKIGTPMNNDQKQPDKPVETTKQTMPGSPVQAGQPYETPEPKRRQPETPAEAERAPQHQPGFEAKQKAEADKAKPDDKTDHKTDHKPVPRAHTARTKQHVKHMAPKAKARRHK
jgi:hypothetical protein